MIWIQVFKYNNTKAKFWEVFVWPCFSISVCLSENFHYCLLTSLCMFVFPSLLVCVLVHLRVRLSLWQFLCLSLCCCKSLCLFLILLLSCLNLHLCKSLCLFLCFVLVCVCESLCFSVLVCLWKCFSFCRSLGYCLLFLSAYVSIYLYKSMLFFLFVSVYFVFLSLCVFLTEQLLELYTSNKHPSHYWMKSLLGYTPNKKMKEIFQSSFLVLSD